MACALHQSDLSGETDDALPINTVRALPEEDVMYHVPTRAFLYSFPTKQIQEKALCLFI